MTLEQKKKLAYKMIEYIDDGLMKEKQFEEKLEVCELAMAGLCFAAEKLSGEKIAKKFISNFRKWYRLLEKDLLKQNNEL